LLELTCEKQTDKKVAVFSDQISAVIVSQKSGVASCLLPRLNKQFKLSREAQLFVGWVSGSVT
ncbi:MAG: hypothetical protein ACKPI8_21470, partial [Microcystis panniformis]